MDCCWFRHGWWYYQAFSESTKFRWYYKSPVSPPWKWRTLMLFLLDSSASPNPANIKYPTISVPFFRWSEFDDGTFSFASCWAAYVLSHSSDSLFSSSILDGIKLMLVWFTELFVFALIVFLFVVIAVALNSAMNLLKLFNCYCLYSHCLSCYLWHYQDALRIIHCVVVCICNIAYTITYHNCCTRCCCINSCLWV